MEKKYWKGIEELRGDADFVRAAQNEFAEGLPIEALGGISSGNDAGNTNRRDFLKFLGFGVAAATLASCEAPVKKTIPYLIKPEEIVPGVPNWYASTYFDGMDYASILVKTREGRPIKVEGNKMSSVSMGSVESRVHASVLSLYDSARLKTALAGKKEADWEKVDEQIGAKLAEAVAQGKQIRILTSTIISPSLKAAIAQFSAKYAGTKVVTYDAYSSSATLQSHAMMFNKAVVPSYRADNAGMIVGVATDFLSNPENAKMWIKNRRLAGKKTMSRFVQFETNMSLTGANADKRVPVKVSEQGKVLVHIYNKIASLAGVSTVSNVSLEKTTSEAADKAAKELWENRGRALVLAGANDLNVQLMANAINYLLESYGATIDLDNVNYTRQGNDAEVMALVDEMNNGSVGALLMLNTNPVYTIGDKFKNALSKVALKVSFAEREDETASLCDFVTPDHHYLEAWTDAEAKPGQYSLGQPTISPLFKTRSAIDTFTKWAGSPVDSYTFIRNYWSTNLASKQASDFETFWGESLQNGVFQTTALPLQRYTTTFDISAAAASLAQLKGADIEAVIYMKAGIGTGSQANNPWLQELPDPISKVCWDNYVTISPRYAAELGLNQEDVVTVSANGVKVEAPVFIQPGQAYKTIGMAIGYGRTNAGKVADNVGFNAYPFVTFANGSFQYSSGVSIDKTAKTYPLAATQTHHTMMGRAIVKETSLPEYQHNNKSGNPDVLITTVTGEKKKVKDVDFWEGFEKPNHQWGLAIDLNSCTGCGSCVVSCNAENNVPVVGKDEVKRSREMHWIRIDRYYSSDADGAETKDLAAMEVPGDNPRVVFQPVMCQHCNHAPCETVCPVVATTHSSEGLNQMAYNRCVGTRYCANNCPYKVRRFNWFKYSDNKVFDFNMNDDLGKMVLNPDVVVRSRGVMEKCSMCVQRIQAGKLEAKKESRRPVDGEIEMACSQSCPTDAIVFGDLIDPNSRISQMVKDERSYFLLEEINVQPSVYYQTKVRNVDEPMHKDEAKKAAHHEGAEHHG